MKCQIPQISWHSRDPVLSIDFQPCDGNKFRLASGGTDSHVLIWYVTYQENKSISIECASDLYRHNKSVNVVRFSPNGDLLASGDDEGSLIVWQQKERDGLEAPPKDEENINQEDWCPIKVLRGHLEDIYDISWSADGNFMVSGSLDNTAIMWDMQKFQKVHIFPDSKGYVQGVTWDPLNTYIATIGTDRALRIININHKKTAYKVLRAPWSVTTEKGTFRARLFYDDTLKSYFRRLCFTPDGELLIVPSGILEKDEKFVNTTYIFSRHSPNKPVAYLPTGDKYTVAVKCNPLLFKLRRSGRSEDKENEGSKCVLNLPYRMVFAVAACDSIVLYDTEQLVPIAYVSNIHYTHLTDLTWSADGRILVASSTDGYCSFVIFSDGELGEVYVPPPKVETPKKDEPLKDMLINSVKPSVEKTEEISKKVLSNAVEKADDEAEKTTKSETEKSLSIPEKKPAPVSSIETKSPKHAKKATQSESEKTHSNLDKKPVPISPKESPSVKPKKPKLTIESFFVSPKIKPANNDKSEPSTSDVKSADVKDVLKNKLPSNNTTPNGKGKTPAKFANVIKESGGQKEGTDTITPMEVDNDSCSIEVICEVEKSTETNNPRCRIQLDFAGKVEDSSKESNLPDLNDDVAVAAFPVTDENIAKEAPSQGDDWKLELSQDEEMVPMDTVEPSTSKEVEPSTSKVEASAIPTTPKPKRRINLITLSKNISKTPTKQ